MATMIISGGGMTSNTAASYFTHTSITLQLNFIQVCLPNDYRLLTLNRMSD